MVQWIRRGVQAACMAMCLAEPVAADAPDSDKHLFEAGGDRFIAGRVVKIETPAEDLFALAGRLDLSAPLAGAAHLLARRVSVDAPIGGGLYAAAQKVTIDADLAGAATLAGQEIEIDAAIAGNLRVAASEVEIEGAIGGTALIAAETLSLDASIGGDLYLVAQEVDFGDDARIDGRLVLYERRTGALAVPEAVIPAERIERRLVDRAGREGGGDWRRALAALFGGMLAVAALAALAAVLAPVLMSDLRRVMLDRPGRALVTGFVAQSALIGAGAVLTLTLIGVILVPAAIVLAFGAALLGYLVGVYAFGVGLLGLAGRAPPDDAGDRILAAGAGALAAALIALVPLVGWLFGLALALAGLGAITQRAMTPRPGF